MPVYKVVNRKVSRLRRLIRLYIVLETMSALILMLGLCYWFALVIDWSFEPSPIWRILQWAGVIGGAGYILVHFLFSRLLHPLTDANLAMLLERNFPAFNEGLITSVEAMGRNDSLKIEQLGLLRHTGEIASDIISQIKLTQVFNPKPLLWKLFWALLVTVSIAAFAVLQSEAHGFWMQRMLLSEELWPRKVRLHVVDFSRDSQSKVVKVARDDDYTLKVEASMEDGFEVPENVELRYRLTDGRRGRDILTKVGEAVPGRDANQLFRYSFNNVAADLSFDLIGGDDRIYDLQLQVVERPKIEQMSVDCVFPGYLKRSPEGIPVSNRTVLPEGTKGVFNLTASKPLEQVLVYDPALQEHLPATILSEQQQFQFEFDAVSEDRVFLITMQDFDGIENREPYRIVLSVLKDQPPDVTANLRGIGNAITPQAIIPFQGKVSDEYGIEEVWYEFQINESPIQKRSLDLSLQGRRELSELGKLDLAETDQNTKRRLVELQPGQQLVLSLKARDAYDLQEPSHTGSSQRFRLDVVSNSDLRALLEKRELALRQRFEAIYEKMIISKELLHKIEASQKSDQENNDINPERGLENNRLRISGVLQTTTQLAFETLGVADGFQEIVEELQNNRVDTEELEQRLVKGIAEPLSEIGAEMMPQLEQRLSTLQTSMKSGQLNQEPLTATILQAEKVTDAMKEVLDRMLELESYNELVELLRTIVKEQQQLQEKTKKERRAKLRRLLDE